MLGAGTASFAAYRAIKSRDPTAKILIVGDENRYDLTHAGWFLLLSWFPLSGCLTCARH